MSGLIYYCPENARGKHDGDEFEREARAYASMHGGFLIPLTGTRWQRRKQFVDGVIKHDDVIIERIAYFGHGVQAGLVGLTRDAREFAKWITRCGSPSINVVLYACLCGGAFAAMLRSEIARTGVTCVVHGHTTAGHTTRNPYVTRYTSESKAHDGYLVSPKSDLWDVWRRALDADGLRFRYPYMSVADLERFLRGVDVDVADEPRG